MYARFVRSVFVVTRSISPARSRAHQEVGGIAQAEGSEIEGQLPDRQEHAGRGDQIQLWAHLCGAK